MGKPKAPDPWQTASAQGSWNTFTAQQNQAMNMVGQDTPWGTLEYQQSSSSWMTDPSGKRIEVPQYTANVNLTPEQQAIFSKSQEAQGNLANIAADQSAKVGEILNDPFEFNNQDAENWAYDLASPRILQQQQQNESQLRNRLINQGIRPGTTGWDSEMSRLTNANTDQMNQLALTGRSQAFSEALAQRNQPLNEIIGLQSGTQIQNPTSTFAQTPQVGVAGVDYTGLVNQKYQADVSRSNAMMGGLFGLGSALIGLSDIRLKTDIKRIGSLPSGLGIYSYRFKGTPCWHVGVMAQEVAGVIPEAVTAQGDYLRVEYGSLY